MGALRGKEMKGRNRRSDGQSQGPVRVGFVLIAVVASLIFIRIFIADLAIVQGRSMLPSLGSGDVVFLFKAAYGLRNPYGGYLVLWRNPDNRDIVAAMRPDTNKVVIKRVWIEKTSAENEFLLLGDNKYESVDSREFGLVPMNNILGKVLLFPRF